MISDHNSTCVLSVSILSLELMESAKNLAMFLTVFLKTHPVGMEHLRYSRRQLVLSGKTGWCSCSVGTGCKCKLGAV